MWLREIVEYLRRYIKFPKKNVPDFGISEGKPSQIDAEYIDELAAEARRAWGIGDGPIPNMAALLEKNGVVVARHDLDSNKLDAFSEWNRHDETPYVILNSEKASAVRSRYDAGHELAHLLLHRGVTQATLNTRSMFSLMEEQANRFSGAFLLPESTFTKDLHSLSLDSLRVLKPKWRVSVGVMIKRVAHLGLVSESEERRLWINYGRRGWRRREPLDDQLAEEQPRYIRRCIELLIEKDVVPREELPFRLALPAQDIENLIGLPSGFFSPPEPEVALTRDTERDVIPFPN
jgi:Zn-dependent peptidase ImmA (M78 family)